MLNNSTPQNARRAVVLMRAWVLFFALLLTITSYAVVEPALTAEEHLWIKENPVVRYTGDPNWLPVDIASSEAISSSKERYADIVSDYIQYVANNTGLEFRRIIAPNLIAARALAGSGQVDMISGDAADRALERAFSPLGVSLKNAIAIVVDSRQPPIENLNAISDKKIAVIRGYGYITELKAKYPAIPFIEVDNIHQALRAVSQGRYDAVLASTALGSHSIEQLGLYNLKFAGLSGVVMKETFFIANDKPLLKSIVEKTLATITSAERTKILNRWMPPQAIAEQKPVPRIQLSDAERTWLEAHPTLRFVGDPDWLPYEAFDENGNYIGIVAEHLELIEEALDIRMDIVQTAVWSESVAKAKAGDIDIISETTDSSLGEQLQFTRPYVKTPLVVVMRHDEDYVADLRDISDRKIAVIRTYGYVTKIRERYQDLEFHEVGHLEEGLIAVSTGQVDALICSLAHASHQIPKMALDNIKIAGKTEFDTEMAFGIQPHLAPLVPLLNRAIEAISPAEHQRIMESWVTDKYVEKTNYKLLILAIFASLVIIGYIYYWNRKLAKNIEVRRLVQSELAVAKEEADAANAAKSRFLATMSHEIRTPMNGVLGMLELLSHTPLDRDQKESVGIIQDSAQSLLAIINDVLDFSRIEANRMEVDEVAASLGHIIESVLSAQAQAAYDKKLRVRLYIDPALNQQLIFDPVRLRQILTNLVSNAIKFTSEGMITLRADCLHKDAANVGFQIDVEDTGIGIAAADQKHLFNAFSQAESSTTRRFGGSGLGLSICQRLAELMQGTLTLSSEPNHGTTMSYRQTAALSNVEANTPEQSSDKSCLLLTVDEFTRSALLAYLHDLRIETIVPAAMPIGFEQLENTVRAEKASLLIVDESLFLQSYRLPLEAAAGLSLRLDCPVVALTTEANLSANDYRRNFASITTNPLQPASLMRAISVTLNAEAVAEDTPSKVPKETVKRDARILVVEDHPINQQLITKQLHLLGYACEVHDNGEQGLLAWKSAKFDAIVTDCHMPVMDGYAMALAIREIEAESSGQAAVPIIALTANAMTGEAGKCLAAGMNDYMSKPVQLETIRRKLDYWITGTSNDRRIAQWSHLRQPEHGTLNLVHLQDSFKDTDQIANMLEAYVESNHKDLLALQSAVSKRDTAMTKDVAHRIKGAAKIMAADNICALSEQLEKLAIDANWGEASLLLNSLAAAMRRFANDVTIWCRGELELI